MKVSDPFDLTPISIRRQQLANAALTRYAMLAITLVGLLSGLVVMRWQERELRQLALRDLMAKAVPIRDQRLESLQLHQSNEQLKKIVTAVASAEPRDSLLQSFAALTEGVVSIGFQPRQLHLRLAIEPVDGSSSAVWAKPTMQMTVESEDDSLAVRAHESLANEDRFKDVQTLGVSKLGKVTRTDLVAIPRAEALLP
jgi:hypothetical protein